MLNPIILVFQAKRAGVKSDRRIGLLQAHGFEVISCTQLLDLYRSVQANLAQAGNRLLVLLAGPHPDNCIAASYLRTLCPAIGLVAMLAENDDAACLQLMQSGADNYCRHDASFELLLATALRLLARMGADLPLPAKAVALVATDQPPGSGYWQLLEQGWVLAGPQEQRIPLTTGERAFLAILLTQPGLRAEHKQLIAAVNTSYALDADATRQGRLGLLVSRLRRKLREHGITDIPLKSLHSWGYMFTGPVF